MGIGNFLRDLTSIKSRISGFYRPNRFFLMLLTPAASGIIPIPLPIDPLIVKVASMPARSTKEIKMKKMGTEISIPTFNEYSDFTVTITTWNFADYRMIQSWMDDIYNIVDGNSNSARYKGKSFDDFKVTAMLGATGDNKLTSYIPLHDMTLHGLYPKELGEIQFSQDASTEFISYDVTFNVDYVEMMTIKNKDN